MKGKGERDEEVSRPPGDLINQSKGGSKRLNSEGWRFDLVYCPEYTSGAYGDENKERSFSITREDPDRQGMEEPKPDDDKHKYL